MDIRPIRPGLPRKPTPPSAPPTPVVPPTPTVSVDLPAPLSIDVTPAGLDARKKKNTKRIILFSLIALAVLIMAFIATAFIWYNAELSPVDSKRTDLVKVTIDPGTSPKAIGELLKAKGVIRNTTAYTIYTRLEKAQNSLQAGTYRLSPAESTPQIVTHLTNGNVDTFKITFLPGATLAENRKVLLDAGYTTTEVDTALGATYDSSLFDTKPSSADLEGYIYGETYNFSAGASVQDILARTFEEYAQVIKDNDLVAKFQSHGLTLFQGITLASIVQREATKGSEAQIAQVFYLRLAQNMPLGSDVTYQYIADKTGVARDPNLDSPYNTRRYAGLPPGPISTPGLGSLEAVATPAVGDYLYFLSGDDNVTYYAHTLSEHEANIAAHCKVKCSTL
ncbi:MAG: Aminodeoxychorismate lyase [Candidatus Saccharibacteria bacterium]|nr:Aminodeoxychorismate lyase [Candidatus Saccharibacteria bacterium]